MIEAVEIERLRGISQGRLEGLTPLVVLVGPNGGGKSTVLDALHLGASPDVAQALGEVVSRRRELVRGARWLLNRGGTGDPAILGVRSSEGRQRSMRVQWGAGAPPRTFPVIVPSEALEAEEHLVAQVEQGEATCTFETGFFGDRRWKPISGDIRYELSPIRTSIILEPQPGGPHEPLATVYSTAVQHGRRRLVRELLAAVIPGLEDIQILTDEDNRPVVHCVYEWGSVPIAVAGSGIQALARLCIELAGLQKGLALIEEPEVHQHPASLRQTARAMVEATDRGVQIVMSTHSLELIDALVDAVPDDRLERLTVYRLTLDEGVLRSSRIAGPDVAFMRAEIEEDLR